MSNKECVYMMKVGFNPGISFKSSGTDVNQNTEKGRVTLPDVQGDAFTAENKKGGSSLKNGVAKTWKFFSVAETFVGSVLKGLVYGTLASGAAIMLLWPFKALPKAFAKASDLTLKDVIKHPVKHLGKGGKIAVGALGLGTLVYHLVAGKLRANQNTAVIDHKLHVGHRDV